MFKNNLDQALIKCECGSIVDSENAMFIGGSWHCMNCMDHGVMRNKPQKSLSFEDRRALQLVESYGF